MSWKTPTLADCRPDIEPTEYQVLVRMASKPAVTTGGILLPAATSEKEQWGAKLARLVAVSPLAFSYAEWPADARKPQVGDVVFVGLYPGEIVEGADGEEYRLCSDREIGAVVERAQRPSRPGGITKLPVAGSEVVVGFSEHAGTGFISFETEGASTTRAVDLQSLHRVVEALA